MIGKKWLRTVCLALLIWPHGNKEPDPVGDEMESHVTAPVTAALVPGPSLASWSRVGLVPRRYRSSHAYQSNKTH